MAHPLENDKMQYKLINLYKAGHLTAEELVTLIDALEFRRDISRMTSAGWTEDRKQRLRDLLDLGLG